MRDRRLPLRFTRILPSSGLLRSVGWLRIDVSGQPMGPIFNTEARSRNHYCRGKEISIKHSKYVFVALLIHH